MKEKKKYQKPEVCAVELKPEEAVLANCKSQHPSDGSGWKAEGCYYLSMMGVCWASSNIGS